MTKNNSAQTHPITPVELESLLEDTFLRSLTHYSQTDSTNTRAIELLTSGDSDPAPRLVYAESQVAGRGRGANQWWSAGGSLTFSLIVNFQEIAFAASQKPQLPLLTGMAILRTGKRLLPDGDFKLKWPNDVFLSDQKLAGVLIEVPSQSCDHAVIGVGLNVNNSFANAPAELASTGTSIIDHSESRHCRVEVLRMLLQELESLLVSFAAGQTFLDDWPEYCLLTGKQVTLLTGTTQVVGRCHGVDRNGALVLETSAGPKSFFGGVIQSWS